METPNIPGLENPAPARSKAKWAVVAIVALILIGAGLWAVLGAKLPGKILGVTTSYQAVFLTNGQVYFGKLEDQDVWMKLTNIYYLQVTQPLQQTSTSDQPKTATPAPTASQSNIQLVKLGSELHGPEDVMYIERDKILFWENLKDDSKVVQAIHQYQSR